MDTMNETSYALRLQKLRAGLRVNSRVRVTLLWEEAGQHHQATGYTMDISPKGCLAVVAQGFAVGQKLKLRNSITGNTSDARLIWRGHEGRAGWELGLELDNPPEDFWGLEF